MNILCFGTNLWQKIRLVLPYTFCMRLFMIYTVIVMNSTFMFSQESFGAKSYAMSEKNDYSFLAKILENKRVVLLGEQTHGDGATFEEKVKIVKYLTNKLKFNTIVFESGMYENYKAWKLYAAGKATSSIYNESIYSLWSTTQSFQKLLDHIDRKAILKDTIKIIGFDCQEKGELFKKYFIDDLKKTFNDRKIIIDDQTYNTIEKVFVDKNLKEFAANKKDSIYLYQLYELLLSSFQRMHNLSTDEKMIKQVVLSQIAQVDFDIKILQGQKIAFQNPRDAQMAKNLIFLTELYPNEKMVCWGASYHFSNRIKDFDYTDITEDYLKRQLALEQTNSVNSISTFEDVKMLGDAHPMGEILKDHFKSKIYSIAFSSFEGEYGIAAGKSFPILTPPSNSIEQTLAQGNNNKVFLDFDKKFMGKYYCSALGNMPLKANWNSIFDGLFFIKTAFAPPLNSYKSQDISSADSQNFSISGEISEFVSDKIIPNADIYLMNCNKSVVGNDKGMFRFTIPKSSFNDKLIISAMGYYSDTLSVSQLEKSNKELLKIKLKKETDVGFSLNEVLISSAKKKMNTLSAKAILKRAKSAIQDNYYQLPFNQKFFFRAQTRKETDLTFNEIAFINTYNPNGFKVSQDPASNYFGEILQYKNIANNESKENWKGIGYLGVMVFRSILLSNQNVLYKTSSFDLQKEKIIEYNGRKVYVISFINKAPDVFSTGFGNPPPKSATGYIYIDVISFAILKFEHFVVLHPDQPNDQENVIIESTHKITETFKLVNGKYFINYCNEKVENKYLSKKDKKFLSELNTNYDLMSVDITTDNVEIISRPIDRLKLDAEIKDNSEYLNYNNFLLEDGDIKF
ncbi:erythromycin esterase family protein [Flavobacterium poyangense]|uniref:erythromycin esterase family protein n=1 Tax=Flavobacterium poyangense TaxID=2204302 RepID=UPI001420530B|nr:erythromycin esterase family protein [Flavobacterium sp. JXAS1]